MRQIALHIPLAMNASFSPVVQAELEELRRFWSCGIAVLDPNRLNIQQSRPPGTVGGAYSTYLELQAHLPQQRPHSASKKTQRRRRGLLEIPMTVESHALMHNFCRTGGCRTVNTVDHRILKVHHVPRFR